MKIKDYIDKIALVSLVLIFLVIGYFNNRSYENIDNANLIETVEESIEESIEETEIEIQDVYVHVSGCVINPGVYKLSSDSRINDAIKLAGGLCENNDISSINLSEKVYDEMKIHVYEIGEEVISIENETINSTGKINLNTASKEELLTLTGIGEKKAEEIIEYRNQNKFESIDDLKNISGIGDKTFEKLKDNISVD